MPKFGKMKWTVRLDEISIERVLHEVRDAFLGVEATGKSAILYRGELLPKGAQSLDVSHAGYEKGKDGFLDLLDAERSQRQNKPGYDKSLAENASALADERSVGADLRRKP